MEIVISIGAKLSEYTVAPIARQLGYLFYYQSNLENLRTQVQKLKDAKERLKHSIDEAKRNGEEIEAVVLNWISRVDGISDQTLNLCTPEGQGNSRCFSARLFPNLVLRKKLSRKAKTLAIEIGSEIQNAAGFNKVSYLPFIESSVLDVKGYVAFQSRMSTVNQIMEALTNPNLEMIGVYGMGGVGKTMLSKEVAKQAKEQMLFSKVIIVTVSQSPNVENIQQEIAEQLRLKLEEKTKAARADRLRYWLRQEKKILVILDDIWEKLELEDIGINFGNDRNICKILLTSRSEDVLHNDMGVEQNFLVGVLSEREAASLFNSVAGDTVKNLAIQPLASKIVNECGGLPIAIATVGNALRNKSPPVWNNALQELRASTPTNIKGMHVKVYSCIRLSYDSLSSEEAKSLLLLCSLFPEDEIIDIDHLLRHGAGWGLFHGISKLEEARNKVVTLVEDLKTRCLLLNSDFNGFVKMHDVIRDVTVSIASRERHMHNLSVAELEECSNETKLNDSIAVSLSEIVRNCHLPERLIFPNAQVLFMRNGGKLFRDPINPYVCNTYFLDRDFKVSSRLFEELKKLRVLELRALCLKPLPSSFSFLRNLQTLCLPNCNIGEVAMIGELKNLKILDLTGSNIEELPKEIGQLTRLRLLDLKYCSKLKVIQPITISSLTSLQELNMKESFTNWKEVGRKGDKSNASLIELKSLHLLASLHLYLPSANILPNEIFSEKLERYDIIIGDVYRYTYVDFGCSRTLFLELDNKSDVFSENGLEMLLKKSEALYLNGLEGFNNVVRELDVEGFPQLKHLRFEHNHGIQYIVNSMADDHTRSAFVNLEVLNIGYLENLEKICHGKLAENCFGKLREIRVGNCGKLKNLFPFSVAEGLLQLEKIEMKSCEMMEEIIIYEREGDSQNIGHETDRNIQFPQLHTLILSYLPKLIQFYSPANTNCRNIQRKSKQLVSNFTMSLFNEKVTFPKLQNLTLRGSPTLNELWHGQSEDILGDEEPACLFSGLKVLTVSELPNLIHIWDEKGRHTNVSASLNLMNLFVSKCNRLKNLAPSWISFQNLIFLGVSKCNEMVNLLTLSTAKSLTQLRMMSVVGCKSMTEIIEDKGSELGGHDDRIVFDHLVALELHGLLSLTSFYSGKLTVGFPKLKYVSFDRCPNLRSFSHVVSTPQLHKIVLHHGEQDEEEYDLRSKFFGSDNDMDVDWPLTDKELDLVEAVDALSDFSVSDFSDEYNGKPVEELMNGDINNALSQMWESNQIGLALRQLFTEQVYIHIYIYIYIYIHHLKKKLIIL
ncbi:hypothetical protein FNV43_RR02038 [Rhamnella rubrinervis]|uniref:AAA+ ATPase domain-containing protein n=1 Tax=Rhamnella rubrinervis TaxID=2594499 RepID=A0A8K0HQR5_9ROSA|nr:hypothetical protein FNV43_RR02038 [Rhamnella rubrinervis]